MKFLGLFLIGILGANAILVDKKDAPMAGPFVV